jgi:hypothetical protein
MSLQSQLATLAFPGEASFLDRLGPYLPNLFTDLVGCWASRVTDRQDAPPLLCSHKLIGTTYSTT